MITNLVYQFTFSADNLQEKDYHLNSGNLYNISTVCIVQKMLFSHYQFTKRPIIHRAQI